MSYNKTDNKFEQLSIFDVLKMSNAAGADFSSEELEAAIGKLQEWQSRAKYREKKEKEKDYHLTICYWL